MLVHVKVPHTELPIELRGPIPAELLEVLSKQLNYSVEIVDEAKEDAFETSWFTDISEQMTPGDFIRVYRENHSWTQAELGKKLGSFSRQYISDLERGKRLVSKDVAKKLSQLFDVSISRFI